MPNRPPRHGKRHATLKNMSAEGYRRTLNEMAAFGNEYAGLPMTFKGQEVVVHPSYKFAEIYNRKSLKRETKGWLVRNRWRHPQGYDVCIVERPDGKRIHAKDAPMSRAALMFATMEVGNAWTVECESRALEKLRTLIPPHLFDLYVLTGMFPQTSVRSGISYLFRKLRPTVALTPHKGDSLQVLCCLCLHPIGYYKQSWGGVMTPTDEVIAHLMLMRGDEHDFWKQANHHAAWRHESGL